MNVTRLPSSDSGRYGVYDLFCLDLSLFYRSILLEGIMAELPFISFEMYSDFVESTVCDMSFYIFFSDIGFGDFDLDCGLLDIGLCGLFLTPFTISVRGFLNSKSLVLFRAERRGEIIL